ncbi:MAG TPA: hypothetical protein VI072_21155 [Polyangiaceae bacterium]
MKRALVCAFLTVVSGCSKSAPPPGKVTSIENICQQADESRVRVTGYVRYRRGLLSFCSSYGGHKTCDLALYAGPEKPPDYNILRPRTGPEPTQVKISVPVGDEPGQMPELPEKFKESDIAIYLPNKAKAAEGSRVTLDGTLKVIPGQANSPKSCYINVEWATAG